MNIYGSLLNIFDEKTPLPFYFMRQPNPERGLFMDIQKNNL